MTKMLTEPTPPLDKVPTHVNFDGQRVAQFRIVTRHAVVCSCGEEITNPNNIVGGERLPWYLTSNDARHAAEAHFRARHR